MTMRRPVLQAVVRGVATGAGSSFRGRRRGMPMVRRLLSSSRHSKSGEDTWTSWMMWNGTMGWRQSNKGNAINQSVD